MHIKYKQNGEIKILPLSASNEYAEHKEDFREICETEGVTWAHMYLGCADIPTHRKPGGVIINVEGKVFHD